MNGRTKASKSQAPSLSSRSFAGSLPSQRSFAKANLGMLGALPDRDA